MSKERDFFRPNDHVRPIGARIYDKMQEVYRNRRKDPNWMTNEVLKLWEFTNYERTILGKGPISLEKVQSVERCAQGSIDYSLKCALWCDDLVTGRLNELPFPES